MVKMSRLYCSCACGKWKTRSQLLCCSSIVSILITIIVYLIELLLFQSIATEFMSSSNQLFEQQTQKQLRQFMDEQIAYSEWFFIKGSIQLTAINDIYQAVQSSQLASTVPSYDCLTNNFNNDTYAYNLSFCYMFCNTEQQIVLSDHKHILNLTALLTQYLPIFDSNRYIYYASSDPASFWAINKGKPQFGFKAQKRPWYLQYMEKLQEHEYRTSFSDPYMSWGNFVVIAQNADLTNLQGELVGVSGQDFQLEHIILMNDSQQHLMIANSSGYLMVGSYYIKMYGKFLTVYNTSVTGFTYQDWQLMKITADNNSRKVLRIVNSALKTNTFVTVDKIKHPEYYFIIFSEFPQITEDEKIINEKLLYFQEYYNKILILTIIISLTITILQMLLIVYIINPVKKLSKVAEQSYSNKFNKLKSVQSLGKTKANSGTIDRLLSSYHNMINNFTNATKKSKCGELTTIDNIQYPSNFYEFEINQRCFQQMVLRQDQQVDALSMIRKHFKIMQSKKEVK